MSDATNNNTPKPQPQQPFGNRDYCIIFAMALVLFAGSILVADAKSRSTHRIENLLVSLNNQLTPEKVSPIPPKKPCTSCAKKAAAAPISKPIPSGYIPVRQKQQTAVQPVPDNAFITPIPEALSHDPDSLPAGSPDDQPQQPET